MLYSQHQTCCRCSLLITKVCASRRLHASFLQPARSPACLKGFCANMSHPYGGALVTYNSLMDKHLTGYFNNTRIRRHLRKAGLITRSGRIISEREYRLNAMRRDHQRYVRECLAQAIFHKVLDMERHHQIEIKRKLETFARKEQVHRSKVDQLKRTDEEIFPLFSPCPPAGPRSSHGRPTLADDERSESSESSSSSRPNTAPGTLQRPVRLQPLQRTAVVGTLPKSSPGIHQKSATLEPDHRFPCGVNKDILKLMSTMDHSTGPSPYQLPIINNYVAPVPPPPKRSAKNPRHATRGRRIRPTTAPNELDQLSSKDLGKFHKISVHSNVAITMVYLGKSVHLSHDDTDYRDEIKALQQHCGGENLCVYKGKLLEGETFQFTSRRHRGFPFSLTLYLNGLQVDRVSSCCEYRHRRGARLGGKHGHFGLVSVEGASPCYRCIIAMGLDKKPTPPPKKQKDDEDRQVECPMDDEPGEKEGTSREGSVSAASSSSSSSYGEDREMTEEKSEGDGEVMKDKMEEEQDNEENPKDEYDEDFEVYEEKPDDNERGQADDQKNGNSKSTSDDEKDDLDHEKESKNLSQRQHETSDVSEKDEDDRYSDSESEREDRQDRNKRSSISSSNTLYSSSSGDESEAEKPEDHTEGSSSKATEENQPELYNDAETEQINSEESADEDVQRQETDVVEEEESEVTKEEAMSTEDDGPMKDFQDGTSKGLCNVRLMETGTADEGEENVLIPAEEDRTETEYEIEGIRMQEPFEVDDGGDCKLVQEKIAKAIGSAEHLNSEPEPSDSSTDDDDNVTNSVHDVDERKVVSEEKEWIAKELIVSKVEEKFEAEPKKDGSLKELRKEDKDIKDEATEQVAAEKSASLGEEEAQEASPGGEKMSDPEATTMPMDVDVKILKGGSPERVENSSNGTVMAKEMTTNGKELVDRANGLTEEANHESGKIDEGSETTLMGDETNERDGQSGLEEAEALVGTKQEDVLEAAAFVQEEVIEESAPKGEGKKTIKNEEASGEVSSEGKEAIVETTYELEDLAKDIAITMKEVPAEANQGIKIRSDKASHELEEAETKMVDEVRTDKVRTELELMRDEAAHEWEEMGTGTEPNGHRMTEEIVVDNKTPKVVEVDGNKIFVSNQETAMEDAPQLVEVAALKRDKTIEESVTEEEDTTTEAGKCTALEQEEEVVSVKETAKKMVEVEIENVKEEAVITEKVISNTAVPKGENMAEEAEFEQEKLTEELAELTKEELAKETEHECEKATMEVAPMKQEEAEEVAPEEQEEETPVKWEEAAPGEQEEATPLKWEEAEEAPAVKKEEAEEAAPEEQEEETPVKCEEAAPGEQEEEAPVKCEEAAPGEQEEATPLKWEEAEEAPAVKKEEAIELAPVTSEEVEEIANKGELMIEKAAPEREGEGIMEDSSIIRDEMTEEIFEREEVVSHSDEVEKAPIETEKATEETKCETEEAGKEVVPEREEVSEEKISKQEEAAEKVDPEREVVSEERISKQEEVAEK
ncbi:glutamate-rich protein 3 isoform X2 [Rhinatrema bivittatum]|uniref:glutamate-rich protein 3 isoform X2 n=1 Tax=Rhinatrema bivittatum TaxID=194408 RepID=UPI00112BFD7D|nr:glutamate-rich protein 3 isoform X2 [Rhinatrema bivittatum]